MKAGGQPSGNISGGAGETRDIIAQKVGLGSGKTLEAAQKVVERGIPELVEAMKSFHRALAARLKAFHRRISLS